RSDPPSPVGPSSSTRGAATVRPPQAASKAVRLSPTPPPRTPRRVATARAAACSTVGSPAGVWPDRLGVVMEADSPFVGDICPQRRVRPYRLLRESQVRLMREWE